MKKEYVDLSIEMNNRFPVYQEYFDELVDFYKEYFSSIDELKYFMEYVFSFEYDKIVNLNIPRLMINNTMRLAKLATDMEQIRPGKDALKIAYLITGIETLYKLASRNTGRDGKKLNKISTVIDFFETYISEDDKNYILTKVRRSLSDEFFKPGEPFNRAITIEVFARIINETRNVFIHEGDYWSYSLPSTDCPELKIINVEEAHGAGKQKRVYEFELKYDELHQIFVRSFINFIKQYMNYNM